MILKNIIKNLFSLLFKNKNVIENKNPISILKEISNGMGEYAICAYEETDIEIKRLKNQEMLKIITNIESESSNIRDTNFYYFLAIAYRNYCEWFVRGDNKKIYLNKTISYLKKSLEYSSDNIQASAELGELLIEKKIIRNLSEGIKILENLKSRGQMPNYLNSTLSKALRQNGEIEIVHSYNLCQFIDPSPAVFREERKKFRALIRKYKKIDDQNKLKHILNQYYNLAILVTICYGKHDCNSAVSGQDYEIATKIIKKMCNKINFTFQENGYIENSNFISENDWKIFKKIFGNNDFKINPNVIN